MTFATAALLLLTLAQQPDPSASPAAEETPAPAESPPPPAPASDAPSPAPADPEAGQQAAPPYTRPTERPPLALSPAPDPLPHMKWGEPVMCAALVATKSVPSGEFRIQCDDDARTCLVSPTRELDSDGVESRYPLSRVQPCSYSTVDWEERPAQGWRFVPAAAEAPPGWFRDDRGRVMQFNFDLNRRIYLGGAWAPVWTRQQSGFQHRYRADVGMEIEFPDDARDTLYRIHLLEGEFLLGGPTSATLTAFRYDWSKLRGSPLARITTFIIRPLRFDLNLNLGGYLEALTLDTVRRDAITETHLMLGTAQPTFDLWHSRDLVSYVRLRAGPGLVLDTLREELHVVAQAAIESDVTLDSDGFHHARAQAEWEKDYLRPGVPARVKNPMRLRLKAEYEAVVLAINDQPLSVVVDGRGTWRDDLPGIAPGWEWSAGAGLRFSLWAPPRRNAPTLQRL